MVLPRYNRKGSSILQKNPNAIVYFLTSSEGKINYRVRFFCRTLYTLGYPLDRRVFSTGSQDSPPVSLVSEAHRLSGVNVVQVLVQAAFSFLFICFIYFLPTSKLNDNIIITYKKFFCMYFRCSNEKILCDDFKTSTKNLDRKKENSRSSATPLVATVQYSGLSARGRTSIPRTRRQ